MSGRFCAECGKSDVSLVDNFCETCYWKFNHILDAKQGRLEIAYCLTCYSVKLPTGWSNSNDQYDMPEVLGYGYMRNIISGPDVDISFHDVSDIHWMDPNPEFIITYKGVSFEHEEFSEYEEFIDIEIKLLGGVCKACVRRKTGTHDVTVQLRAKDRELTKIEVDTATKAVFELANEAYHETSNAYVSDIIENHGGLDFYLGNNMLADEFIAKLKKIWLGHHEKNYKLITEEKDNTRVYRTTHLYRIPSVTGGEIVIYEETLYHILTLTAKSVHAVNLRTGEIKHIHDWKDIIQPNPPPYTVQKMVISEDNELQSYLLMDMSTYENEEVDKALFPFTLDIGSEISFLYWNDEYFLPYNQ